MAATTTPQCANGCGPAALGRYGLGVLCSSCWTMVPKTRRDALARAARKLGKHPTSRTAQTAFNDAVAVAAGYAA